MGVYLGTERVDIHGLDEGKSEIENLIDESGVLEDTEGTITEKVEDLIGFVSRYNWLKDNVRSLNFSQNTDIKTIYLDCSHINDLSAFVQGCMNLEEIHLTNTQNIKKWQYSLSSNLPKLKTIDLLDFSGSTENLGYQHIRMEKLENLKIVPRTLRYSAIFPSYSPLLSDASIQSIIYGLADLTGQTTQTITFHKDVKAKLTQEQIATITSKNWTLA